MTNPNSNVRTLVIGGAGAIGSNLVRRLAADGYRVAVFTLPGPDLIRMDQLKNQIEIIIGDLTVSDEIRQAIERIQPQIVYHLASSVWARVPGIGQQDHLKVSGLGTLYLMEALKDKPGTRVVFTGTAAVYGPGEHFKEDAPIIPNTVFGACKAAASTLLQTYGRISGLSTVELRFFMPYGPWEHPHRLIPQTILSVFEKRDLPMTSGEQKRDPVYIDDVVEALVLAGTKEAASGSIFNIGSGEAIPVKDIVGQIFTLMNSPTKPLLGRIHMRQDEIMTMSADITAARKALDWEPRVTLAEGLKKTIAWWEQNRQFAEHMLAETATASPPASAPQN